MNKAQIQGVAVVLLLAMTLTGSAHAAQPDIVFADFESPTYGDWVATGKAFGEGPAEGTLPHQMEVSGFKGKRLVNSFHGGDAPTGTLTSPAFTIERKYIAFLIGGGGLAGKTCVNLIVDDKVVRTATGDNTKPGGHETLETARWDVAEFAGKSAKIQIVDNASGGWGHILVDQIVFTDTAVATIKANVTREMVAQQTMLLFPVKNGAAIRKVKVSVDNQPVREFTIEAADDAPDWLAPLDVSAWRGKTLAIEIDRLTEDSRFLTGITQSDTPNRTETLYREPLRPQFHFSPARGWNNDPNGMVFFNGEYHLFFQLNPYSTKWGNMHWGHAVSKDLVHWQELPIALYPDEFGPMFSGSAVVDWRNTSGLGTSEKPPLVLIYTAAGKSVQCIASSVDGRAFAKYANNPVVPMITGGNRDPKVFWHEATHQWVMALYVGFPLPAKEGQAKGEQRHTIHFLNSPNLKDWKVASQIEGFYECPDMFPLAVDGDPKNTKWVLTAASSEYMIGTFDGAVFTPETGKLKGQMGRGFYAAQTFSDIPSSDGRRIQIGWLQAAAPGMSFNQAMSVPLELRLLSTPEGPRLSRRPVKELESLRTQSQRVGPLALRPGDANPLAAARGESLEVRVDFESGDAAEISLTVRGVPIRYDVRKQELTVANLKPVAAPLRDGRQQLMVLADRNCFAVFASEGLTYVPLPIIPKGDERMVELIAIGGTAKIIGAEVHELRSMWGE